MVTEYKGYRIVSDKTYGYYEVKFVGKGSLPNSLTGKYTKIRLAQLDIDKWLDSKPVKEAE